VVVPQWWILCFLTAYTIRRVLSEFFVMKIEAEKTSEALTITLDNLPDAVLMLESGRLTYCNQQADSLFGVKFSQFMTQEENERNEILKKGQYLILGNRCMHELKTVEFEKVVEKMEEDDDASHSIQVTDLGQSVLTLNEVLMTFVSESCMFNI